MGIGSDGKTALSREPYWLEDLDLKAKPRFRIGTFQSVWVKGDDNEWRVMFNGGGPPPVSASLNEVKSLQSTLTCNYLVAKH